MGLFSSKTPAKKYDGSDVDTVIGPEAYFHGVITVRGSLRVDGQVEGSVHEAQQVIVGTAGRVQGDIAAEYVVVGGCVQGDIAASTQLEIRAGGKVAGNIRTAKLLIEEGAVFEGSCVMTGEASQTSGTRRPEPAEISRSGEDPAEETETVSS